MESSVAPRTRALALGAALLLLARGACFAVDAPEPPPAKSNLPAHAVLLPDVDGAALEPVVRSDDKNPAVPTASGQPRGAAFLERPEAPPPAVIRTRVLLIQALILTHYLDFRESLSAP